MFNSSKINKGKDAIVSANGRVNPWMLMDFQKHFPYLRLTMLSRRMSALLTIEQQGIISNYILIF